MGSRAREQCLTPRRLGRDNSYSKYRISAIDQFNVSFVIFNLILGFIFNPESAPTIPSKDNTSHT